MFLIVVCVFIYFSELIRLSHNWVIEHARPELARRGWSAISLEPTSELKTVLPSNDRPFENNGQLVIPWGGNRHLCEPRERQAWEILRVMWPPTDQKEIPIVEVKHQVGTKAKNLKWATNKAGDVRKILSRVQMGFTMNFLRKDDGIEVFQWAQV